jgi:hypothetical protein
MYMYSNVADIGWPVTCCLDVSGCLMVWLLLTSCFTFCSTLPLLNVPLNNTIKLKCKKCTYSSMEGMPALFFWWVTNYAFITTVDQKEIFLRICPLTSWETNGSIQFTVENFSLWAHFQELVLALCYKPEGHGFDSWRSHSFFQLT